MVVNIKEEDYFGIIFTGDWHLEHLWADTVQLAEDLDKIASTPHLYVVHLGDGGDWHNIITPAHKGGEYETMFPPRLTREVLNYLFDLIRDKLIATCAGNHDNWIRNQVDIDVIQEKMKELDVAYLGTGGILRLNIGTQLVPTRQIKCLMYHQLPGSSMYNKLHSLMRAVRMEGFDGELLVSGHGHELCDGHELFNGLNKYYIKTGTYLHRSRWAQNRGYMPSTIGCCPWLVIHPQQDNYIRGTGIDEAVTLLKRLRLKGEDFGMF